MDTVGVAELKAKLSHYLREVRQGRSFTVLSHGMPVATLGPYEPVDLDDLEVIEPDPNAPALSAPVLGSPPRIPIDAVQLIRDDRDDRDRRLDDIVAESLRSRRDAKAEHGE